MSRGIPTAGGSLVDRDDGADAVVNLAGEDIAGGRKPERPFFDKAAS